MSKLYSLYDEKTNTEIRDLTLDDICKLTGLTKRTIRDKYTYNCKMNGRYIFIYNNKCNSKVKLLGQENLEAWDKICAKFRKYFSER